MNSKLRKAIFKKSRSFKKYKTWRTPANWEAYRMQRNLCTKLKRQSIRPYFSERCAGGPKSKDFWPTVKPFLSNKGLLKDPVIILSENDSIISNQISVACTLNEFFVNAAQYISSVPIPEGILNHPSIKKITGHIPAPTGFDFSPVSSESIYTFISKSNPKKANGVDGIPAKIIKSCSKSISEPLAKLINHSFATSAFPNRLKEAQVIPVYKKKDPLDKQNYRPISILPFISKLFENTINSQLSTHFENLFNPFLGAFRPGMGCQSTLLRLVEDWRKAVNNHKYVTAILMDLTKAFDCLPHSLLLGKLSAYGLSDKSCSLVSNYLSNRKQQVKLGPHYSSGLTSSEVYPKALFLGLFFSMFLLMIFFTFWINPLSTIMLMITPCLMLIQILILSFTPCNKTVLLHYNGSISTR